jgi:DNA replication protein DnaC
MSTTTTDDPQGLQVALAQAAARFARLTEDDAFWSRREALLAEREAKARAERKREAAAERARRLAALPARYQETYDPARSRLSSRARASVSGWRESSPRGIGLCGATGLGKTRALCSILRRLSCPWLYLPAGRFSIAVSDQWADSYRTASEASGLLKEARTVKVLLLDDLGDEKHTEAVTAELKELIEYRTSRALPLLWTSNLTPDQIKAKHGERGAAIVRRLEEFTWVG